MVFPVGSGVPKTTLRFNDSPERLKKLSDTVIHMIMVNDNERIRIQICKRVMADREESRETRCEFPAALSLCSSTDKTKFFQR